MTGPGDPGHEYRSPSVSRLLANDRHKRKRGWGGKKGRKTRNPIPLDFVESVTQDYVVTDSYRVSRLCQKRRETFLSVPFLTPHKTSVTEIY